MNMRNTIDELREQLDLPPGGNPALTRIEIDYTNWKGEREIRIITDPKFTWGSNKWHPKHQWLVNGFCHKNKEFRTFALEGIHAWKQIDA